MKKVYNLGWDSVPYGNTDNVFVFWKRYAKDVRTRASKGQFLNDLDRGELPQVSWVIPSDARGWDAHPPADVSWDEPRAGADHVGRRPGRARRTCSPTTSTAVTSTTLRRRRSTHSDWESACRCG